MTQIKMLLYVFIGAIGIRNVLYWGSWITWANQQAKQLAGEQEMEQDTRQADASAYKIREAYRNMLKKDKDDTIN
jgi:hypothetical protein